ncbi:MAG TPA: hypothetical protein VGP21_02840 [Opitutaceae bacterium]|jgi:hypothetical protein|nr:hypothetical protein [Opitutaceae bacterium]
MKNIKKILLSTLVLFSLQFGLGGCIVDGGGYYHDEGPWYHDGPWLYGDGWGGGRRDDGPRGHVDIDIHPPGFGRH